MKQHILIVEDEAIIYERLRKNLIKENFTVDNFTQSVDEAIARINLKKPDLVLLDINLKGEATGLDLGKMLSKTYKIPFIYVTDFNDDYTFFKGLETNHEHFIVKTKPTLDVKQLIRTMYTVLKKNKPTKTPLQKEALLVYKNYITNTKTYNNSKVTQIPIQFNQIAFITTNAVAADEPNTKFIEKLKPNYARVTTVSNESFYVPQNLKPILKILPPYFVRINDAYIVNLHPTVLKGRINGRRININNQILTISDTYRKEVEKCFQLLYQQIK